MQFRLPSLHLDGEFDEDHFPLLTRQSVDSLLECLHKLQGSCPSQRSQKRARVLKDHSGKAAFVRLRS